MYISVIIPTYHRTIGFKEKIEKIEEILQQHTYEIIFVQDGYKHLTKKQYKTICKQYKEITVHSNVQGMILEENVGQQNALLAGISYAKGDYILSFDDDQEDIRDIQHLLVAMKKGYDGAYIIPQTKNKNRTFFRKVGTWTKEKLFFLFLGKPKNIALTSYRIFTKEVAEFVLKDKRQQVYISARVLQYTKHLANYKGNIKVDEKDTGYHWKSLVKLMLSLLRNYSNLPIIQRFAVDGKQFQIKELY